MARKKTTRPASFSEVFDPKLLKQIGFPLAFPIMPLEAFLWASAPWRYDKSSVYDIQDRKITRTDSNNVTHDVANLEDHLQHWCFSIDPLHGAPWHTESIRGDFVGSEQAIELFKGYERQLTCLDETIIEVTCRATSAIARKDKLIRFV